MSSVNNENEELYVIEYKELFFFLFVFLFILVTLFPKELVMRELFAKNDKDYRLSLVYLEDLVKKEPNNLQLQLLLAQKALLANEHELAYQTASKLLKSKDEKIANKALLLAYEALKQEYFHARSKAEKEHIQKELSSLFAKIFTRHLFDDDAAKWYKEAQLVQNTQAALYFLKKMLQNDKNDLERLKEAYYLASSLRKDEEALQYLDLLIQKDQKERFKWKRAKYYLLLRDKKYDELEHFLRKEAKYSMEFAQMLARFYLMRKEYIRASHVYIWMMQHAKGYESKKSYFIQAVDALRAGGHDAMAARLVKRFEPEYMHDKAMREYMLKVYLAANELDFAHRLALKTLHILKKELR